jgi:hypothetical protein
MIIILDVIHPGRTRRVTVLQDIHPIVALFDRVFFDYSQ